MKMNDYLSSSTNKFHNPKLEAQTTLLQEQFSKLLSSPPVKRSTESVFDTIDEFYESKFAKH